MRQPGIEPGPLAWKASILTTGLLAQITPHYYSYALFLGATQAFAHGGFRSRDLDLIVVIESMLLV